MGILDSAFNAVGDVIGGVVNAVGDAYMAVRDPLEALAVTAGNIALPGSSMLTSKLTSKGAQDMLSSDLGKLAQIGTSIYGGLSPSSPFSSFTGGGNSFTGGGGFGSGFTGGGGLNDWITQGTVFNPQGGLGGGGGFDWGQWGQDLLTPQNLFSIGSGLYKAHRGSQVEQEAARRAAQADVWGTTGGRTQAAADLRALMADPLQAAATDPAYRLRLQAAERAAARGGAGSGAMAVQAAQASTDWYNQRLQQLANLAGTQFSPAAAGELALSGTSAATNIYGSGISDIAYGLKTPPRMDPLTLERLRQAGLI